jgi:hypothetical protein
MAAPDHFALRVLADSLDESGESASAELVRQAAGLSERYARALESSGMGVAVLIENGEVQVRQTTFRVEADIADVRAFNTLLPAYTSELILEIQAVLRSQPSEYREYREYRQVPFETLNLP